MTAPLHQGQCLCGDVRFSVRGPLAPIQVCHCSQCRRAQGTPFATNLPVARSAFALLAGADRLTRYESSPGKWRVFCKRCGAPVYSERSANPAVLRLRAGLLDEPLASRVGLHQQVASACAWWPAPGEPLRAEDLAVPRHDGMPPAG